MRYFRASTYICLCIGVFVLTGCQTINRGTFQPFERSLSVTSHGYQVIPDPTGSAPVELVERFEVRPGECSGYPGGWDDCSNDRERSELSEKGIRTSPKSTHWYGWSLYVPEDYVNIYPTKTALGQFHQVDAHPIWMFQNSKGGYHLDNQVYGQTTIYHELISEKDLRGKWHRIEVHAKWADDETGFLKVWVNGEQKVDHSGKTANKHRIYFKYGVYRTFMTRYREANNVQDVPGQVAYFANVRRAKTREGLSPPEK